MGRIRVYQMLGCYPYDLTDIPMEFSPIDEVAKAIVMLSQIPKSCCLFHPYNNHYEMLTAIAGFGYFDL